MAKIHPFASRSLALVLAGLAVLGAPASASKVRQVFARNFTGIAGNPPVVTLWRGPGLTISFVEADEVIRSIALDDPSEVAYTYLDCAQAGSQCEPQLLHLRRIKPLVFAGLTRSSDRSTYMHIVTVPATGGKKRLYTVRVTVGKDNQIAEYHTLQVLSDSQPLATIEVSGMRRASVSDLERGFAKARSKGVVRTELAARVSSFLALVRNGEQPQAAASRAGISFGLVNKLGEWGLEPVQTSVGEVEPPILAPIAQPAPLTTDSTPQDSAPLPQRSPQ